jgi:hypothetical protein
LIRLRSSAVQQFSSSAVQQFSSSAVLKALLLLVALLPRTSQAQDFLGPDTKVDVVFYLDLSESLQRCLGESCDPPTNGVSESALWTMTLGIESVMARLELDTLCDYEFTVYWHAGGVLSNCTPVSVLYSLQNRQSTGGRSQCNVVEVNQAWLVSRPGQSFVQPALRSFPRPPCLDPQTTWGSPKLFQNGTVRPCQVLDDPLCFSVSATDGALCEDWGVATAYVSWYHPWRQAVVCNNYRRYFFPLSDEAPRCGVQCDAAPRNPSIPTDIGGADWRVIVQAGRCAKFANMITTPLLACCAVDGDPSLIDPDPDCDTCFEPSFRNECLRPLANMLGCLSRSDTFCDVFDLSQFVNAGYVLSAAPINFFFPSDQIYVFLVSQLLLPVACDSIDFNGDGLFPADQDLIDFLTVMAGGECSTEWCGDIDFNNDCLFPADEDLISFLRVLAGGTCVD